MPELDKAKNALADLGWSEYESRTYSALVQLGKATASKIAKNSNVPPNRVYQILSKLSEKGVVHTTEARGTATEYEATDPTIVLNDEKREFELKVNTAIEALEELKERKQDTEIPVTYTIYGKRELSTYLQKALRKADKEVFIALDTLIEIQHRELLDLLNLKIEDTEIKILTTERGINDKYEMEIADALDTKIGLKISEDEFASIFMVVDRHIMIYTVYGFRDEDKGELDYYGIYTQDRKTTSLLLRSFLDAYDEAVFHREEDIKKEKERLAKLKKQREGKKDSSSDDEPNEGPSDTQEGSPPPKGSKAPSGPSLG